MSHLIGPCDREDIECRGPREGLVTRLLGCLGFVCGEQVVAVFGAEVVGRSVPICRRSTLEARQKGSLALEAVEEGLDNDLPYKPTNNL